MTTLQSSDPGPQQDAFIRSVSSRLATEFGRSDNDLEPTVRKEFERWSDARVKQFVPVFVERNLRQQLRVSERPVTAR
jgi:hypothetical protein